MSNIHYASAWEQEKLFLEATRKKRPDLFEVETLFLDETVLPAIGITTMKDDRPHGYIKLLPQDFIVEEIQLNERISSVSQSVGSYTQHTESKYIHADLIKVGISTIDAIDRIAEAYHVKTNDIGYAGIKDQVAFTSQRISLPGNINTSLFGKSQTNFFLTNIRPYKKKVLKGMLLGNRFTILVRTKETVGMQTLKESLLHYKEHGFLNYYQSQRFGGTRLASHILGGKILQGKYEEVIHYYLTTPSIYDNLLTKKVRERATEQFGNWEEMKKILQTLPYTFLNELRILASLQKKPGEYIEALHAVQDQTTLWIYAYASLLFNKYLSDNKDNLAPVIPLLLSNTKEDQKIYETYLEEDAIHDIEQYLKPFPYIRLQQRLTPTKISPVNTQAQIIPEGVIMHFCLPKAAYATTFLMNLFQLQQGIPLPEWVQRTEIDTLEKLGIGTIAPSKKLLQEYIYTTLDKIIE